MPKVTNEAARLAWSVFTEALEHEPTQGDELVAIKAMKLALTSLAEADKHHARIVRRGVAPGDATVMVFAGSQLYAIGENLTPDEAQQFAEDIWGAPRIIGEFPPDVDM